MDKQELREQFKQLRSGIPAEERARMDAGIEQQVLGLPEFAAADALLAYLSFGAEVETRGIIEAAWAAGKTVALPRCVPGTRTMVWYLVDSFDGLVRSPIGVEEPAEDPTREVDPAGLGAALVLVPGLTFDAQGFRMGYGGGFYDVFLAGPGAHAVSVGLCREVQLSDRVQALDQHDLPVRIVATEKRVLRPNR